MAKIPKFSSEQEESDFWDAHDATDYLDETVPVDITFVDARPRKGLISIRFDQKTISKLKSIAHPKGIGYQTLLRMWVMERLEQELKDATSSPDEGKQAQPKAG